MTIVLYTSLILVTLTGGLVMLRIVIGPSESDRAAASDMILASIVALFVLIGLLLEFKAMLDVLLIVSSAGLLSTLALVRLILRDEQ